MKPIQLLSLLDLLRKEAEARNVDLTLSMVRVLFLIAEYPGITLTEIKKKMNNSYGNISRLTQVLAKGERKSEKGEVVKKDGLDLIYVELNDDDMRQRRAILTDKGKALFKRIADI